MSSVTKEKYLLHTKMETARMMLAFMCKEKLNQVAELFINTCPYLEYERAANEEGFAPFNFAYQPISDILHDYSQMQRKVSQLVQRYGSNLSYPRMMSDLEKIDYLLELQSNSQSQAASQNATLMGNGQDVHTSSTGQTTAMNQFQGCEQYQGSDGTPYVLLRSCDATGPADEYSQGMMVAAPSAENYASTNLPAAAGSHQDTDAEAPTQYFLVDDNGNQQPITIEILPQNVNDAGCHGAAVQQPAQQSMTVSYASNELGDVSSYPEPAQTHHQHNHHQPMPTAYQENMHVPPSDANTYASARASAPQIEQAVPMPVYYTDVPMTISSGTEQNFSQQPQPPPQHSMRSSEPQNNARIISDIPLTFGTNATTSQCHFQPQENYHMETESSSRSLQGQPQIEVTIRDSVTASNFEPQHPPLVPQAYAENHVPALLTIDTGSSAANPPYCPPNESSTNVTSSNNLLKVARNTVSQKAPKQAQKIRSMDSAAVTMGSTVVQRIHTDERVPLVAKENSGLTHKPKQSEQTLFVTTSIQQGVRVKKFLPSKKEAASETVSSTTPVKVRRVTASPKSQQRSARKASIPPQPAPKPPVSAGDDVGPKSNDPAPEPAAPLSALDEWKRIRSINKSNFDDFARQEICKVEDRLQLIRNEERRQRRKERMRLRRLADTENSNDPSQKASEERGRSNTTTAPGQPAGGRKLTIGQKRKQAALERANAAKRRKRANGGVADESVSNADETMTNANDSLERHAARMEAALATPLKPDEPPPAPQPQPQQQPQQEPPEQEKQQEQPHETDPKTTVQPVSLSLSSANNMSLVVVSSESRESPQPSECTKEESVTLNPPPTEDLEKKQENNDAPPPPPPPEEQQFASEQPSNAGESVEAPTPVPSPAPQVRPKVKVSFAVNKDLKNATARKSSRTKAPVKRRSDDGVDKSDEVENDENESNSSSSSSSSYSSSGESDSDSNSSLSTASSSSDEDENVREMVNNYKRFHGKDQPRTRSALGGRAHSTPVVPKPAMPRTVMPAKGAEQCAVSEKDDRRGETPQSEQPPEPAQAEEKTSDNSCISCSPMKRIEATVSRLAVMRDRPQMKPARRRPLPQQKRQAAVANARAKAVAAAATKSAPPPAAAPAAPSIEVTTQEPPPPPTQPPQVEKAIPTVAVPLRTKTPRKQQLIPTKIGSDGTFIAPSPTPVVSSQQRPKAPMQERQDVTSAPPSKPTPAKTKAPPTPAAVPKRAPPARRLSVQTRQTKQLIVAVEKLPIPDQPPRREPVEEETPAPANVAPDTTDGVREEGAVDAQKPPNPEEGVSQDAIYAVLAQIHGK